MTTRHRSNPHDCNSLQRLAPSKKVLSGDVISRQETYLVPGKGQIVNVYSIEVPRTSVCNFGMAFADTGEYCLSFAKQISTGTHPKVIAAMNCNFGFVTTSRSPKPIDVSFNLKVLNGRVVQLPVADKTACLVGVDQKPRLQFLRARGTFRHAGLQFRWRGALSKSESAAEEVTVFNSFNCKILQLPHAVTGTVKEVDEASQWITVVPGNVLLTIDMCNGSLVVGTVGVHSKASVLRHHMVLSVPAVFAPRFIVGEPLETIEIDNVDARAIKYGCSVGAILTQDDDETEENIRASTIIQTRTECGQKVYTQEARYARACIVETKESFCLFLADARAAVPGQEGLTIAELRGALRHFYPSYTRAANVDGGNASKLVVREKSRWSVRGNLHYKIWPTRPSDSFRWDGVRGRKVPGVIYIY